MKTNHKKAIVIGETNLCISCVEHLINNNWIITVVSDDQTVVTWAKNNSISILPVSQLNSINETNFYLFSIINPHLITKSFLENKNILLAINYHDSPLPKYAGINSTTWAIINNEKSHGITLHQITAGIDDGDIVAQSIINIDKDDTAFSLNLKCSEQLLLLFKNVIEKIENDTLVFSKQSLGERTYYGSKHIPINYSIVNGIKNLAVLHRLIRGSTFGIGYENRVATVKVFMNGLFYIVENFNTDLIKNNYTSDNNTILFNTVRDIYGSKTNLKITYQDIATAYTLTDGDLQYLSNIKVLERRYKKQILNFLSNSEASVSVLDPVLDGTDGKKHTQEIAIPNDINVTTTLAFVYLVLVRFFYNNNFIISLYVADNSNIPNKLNTLVEKRNFIHANNNTLNYGFAHLENYFAQLQKNYYTITKDFGYRYGLRLLTDIAITIGKAEYIDKHKVIIKLEGNKLIISGDAAYQLQISSIGESIEYVFSSRGVQGDITTKDLQCINILSNTEYKKLVHEFNRTDKDYPKNKTIHQLFEEQVLRTPNNIAVVYKNTKLTYQELNNNANQLANYLLQNYNTNSDDLIVLCLDRTEQMLISMLGVLKSGGAYVPLDPNYPDDRVGYILDDTKAKVILTNDIYKNRIQQIIKQKTKQSDVITVDNEKIQAKLAKQKNTNPVTSTISDKLVYVIYTSGTTGNPKGVLIEHRSVTNYMTYLIDYNGLNNTSIGSQYSGFGFDACVIEIYPILLSGGILHIIPERDKLDVTKINDFFNTNKVTYTFLPTKIAESFFGLESSSLINLIVGGEKLEKFSNQTYRIINAYGPTEGTVQSSGFIVSQSYSNIPIGKPINNVKCYVVDIKLNILPIGTVGELMIGGECLARGYLNRPDLTAEKFISNPFQTEEEKLQNKNCRLYKTGDLVRWLPDGNLEYIGRNDFQVKIRGYRIELGEIENKLSNYPGIKQAVALVKERILEKISDKYLLAYYVADKKLNEIDIHFYLTSQLPHYMLPQMLMHITELPLTANGKLDKKALPEPKFVSSHNYVAPETQLQNKIIETWSKVLGISKKSIGIADSFFNLGGNSILAINLVAELSKIKKCKNIKVADIFEYTTVEQLTKFIEPKKDTAIIKAKENTETEIAIIAISGAFSGCENINQYWDLIQKGIEGVKRYTREECIKLGISEEVLANPNFVPTSGHVPNIDKFDAAFWGLAPNEAKSIDPQIRKFLEHCWYVLEESGYLCNRDKTGIGVFAGAGNSGYSVDNQQSSSDCLFSSRRLELIGAKDILATKISHLFGLTGIAVNVNTACSTSLTAVIEACIHLTSGFCDMAIAGGVSLLQPEEVGHIYKDGLIYSKDGYCRVFDNKSSGIIHGSGIGVVLLKRLSDAKKDSDNILAIIKGYGINNDGDRKMSYTSPSITGQKECIVNAHVMAGVTSELIDYVECHGTGTKLGDPIEVQALNEAFKYNAQQNNSKHKCIIGSVKANIGHADSAAGIAGLIKVCKMLEYKTIPGQINYDTINSELHLNNTNFEIITEARKWDQINDVPRIAGVSSFGIGGTNAHVIVSEYTPDKNTQLAKDQSRCIIPLSAKSLSSLEVYKKSFIEYLGNTTDNIQDIAYTLQLKREHFNYRLSIVCDSAIDASNKLKSNMVINRINKQKVQNVVFMLPGQGNQYANMSFDLYQHDSDYKNTVDECIKLANKYTGIQFENILFPTNDNNEINQARWAQLSLFIVEYSLAKLLEGLTVNTVSYIGHSIGEYVAATLSGVFSLEDAIKLVTARGQLMQSMPKGAMLSILANAAEIEPIVIGNCCEMAVINSPKNCVASGAHEYIDNLKAALEKRNIQAVPLKVSHAFHSRFMTEAAREFISQFKQIKLDKPQKRFISNVTGNFITDEEAINPEYWANHMRNPVLFSDGIKTLLDSYFSLLFVEVGTGKSSISFVKQHDDIGKPNTVQLLNSRKDSNDGVYDTNSKEDILSKLWASGYNVDFKSHGKVVRLPSYHFDNISYWINQSRNTEAAVPKADLSASIFDSIDIKNKVVEQNLPNKYYEIAKIFLDVLGVDKISIHDDFFKLGGDSLLAVSVVARLQQNYKISMDGFLESPTIAKISEVATFIKDNLQNKLKQIKDLYAKKSLCSVRDINDMINKQADYLYNSEKIVVKEQKKNIRGVLLTGVTGHVGCNILYKLLHETNYEIYLLIRASSLDDAFSRIDSKYKYYFGIGLDDYRSRITSLPSDIEKQDLGLSKTQYKYLVDNVDSIIHSAALVKHYKHYEESYRTNVQSTINLLELSKLTIGKDFHYVSTIGVLVQDGYVPNRSYFIFHEDDDAGILLERNNPYAKTKYEGELAVNEYRRHGITSNIYRLGNVAMHSTNYLHQENIKDNAFFIQLKTLLNIGVMYDELTEVEVSPVDCTAAAIIKLFDQLYLSNQTYHVFNPNPCNLNNVFSEHNKQVKVCSVDKFIDIIGANADNKQMELFMLHQKWLGEINSSNTTQTKILQNKTSAILAKLGFVWPKITKDMWIDTIKRALDP
ncbi:MAG: amino acid adenylation domain-containing protein [bacterium]